MQKIVPNLWFDKKAEEAVNFYTSLFPNSKINSTSRFGKEGFEHHKMPEGTAMTMSFELEGQQFLALNGGPMFKFNESISFFVYCESDSRIEMLYKKLSENGSVLFPLEKYDWSPKYAWVKDKFGVSWQLDVDKMKSPQKILPTFLFGNDKFDKIKEAMTFYSSIFDNSKVLMEVAYNTEGSPLKETVQFAQFRLSEYLFNAMSSNLKHEFDFNEAISFIINCEKQDEVNYYWTKLTAEGGKESMCGWLKDRFGVSWQVIPTEMFKYIGGADKEKSSRAMNAMFKMKKLDLNILQKAFDELE